MKQGKTQPPIRVGMISLGCAKNLVDAEIMLGALVQDGLEITNDPAQAEALIVNTCSFIDAAQEESVDTILESGAVRDAQRRGQALIVSGCLPQRFRDELPQLLPEVDAFLGIDQVTDISHIVREALERRSQKTASPDHSATKAKGKTAAHRAAGESASSPTKSLRGKNAQPAAAASSAKSSPARHAPASAPPALLEVNRRPTYIPDYATPRFRLTPRHFAYVKIAEGCNHPCSFCIIPRMRGAHRSRPPADVLNEARQLLAEGARELNLISQDTTYYGLDLRPTRTGSIASPAKFAAATRTLTADTPTLCTLLRQLNALPGKFWIRLLYTHPAHWTDELIQTIAECPKVARYVDMPLQHIHPLMLQRMRRETSAEHILELIRRLRAGLPGIALRTTFIVGFPGETEACFQTLLDFIRETRFERLGVFTYSQEAGTIAGKMTRHIPDRVKQQRRDQAMAVQHEVAREVASRFVGRTLPVLVEGRATPKQLNQASVISWEHGLTRDNAAAAAPPARRAYWLARGEADAPDIDGRVYVRGPLPVGQFARVKIIGHTDYDLIAEPRESSKPKAQRSK